MDYISQSMCTTRLIRSVGKAIVVRVSQVSHNTKNNNKKTFQVVWWLCRQKS